ncbi:hypothetical protein [Roseimarinus sediminis]|uniref:hypothetical protein n=1 Tax=Roseimarinus sediminis TaxID=1610899 RepID=UPI003D1F47ED
MNVKIRKIFNYGIENPVPVGGDCNRRSPLGKSPPAACHHSAYPEEQGKNWYIKTSFYKKQSPAIAGLLYYLTPYVHINIKGRKLLLTENQYIGIFFCFSSQKLIDTQVTK